MRILLLSDIHGNYPALQAVTEQTNAEKTDMIFNAGDSTVYAPFTNKVLSWLRKHKVISIVGNTDRKVCRLLRGKNFAKPSKQEKRIMYTCAASCLMKKKKNRRYLLELPKTRRLHLQGWKIGLFHGSPERANEFLFAHTPESRFRDIAQDTDCNIVITGHSHTPYYKKINGVHFINPGSVGRMFDGDPRASCALLDLDRNTIQVRHLRCAYDIELVVRKLATRGLPEIYAAMYRRGRKLN